MLYLQYRTVKRDEISLEAKWCNFKSNSKYKKC